MKISPPIAVLAILAGGLAGAVWLAPPPRQMAQIDVTLPNSTYQKLVLRGKDQADADGRSRTVVQVIEEFTNKMGD